MDQSTKTCMVCSKPQENKVKLVTGETVTVCPGCTNRLGHLYDPKRVDVTKYL